MKRQFCYRLAQVRRWARTPIGETSVVATMTTLSVVLVADIALLAIGYLTK